MLDALRRVFHSFNEYSIQYVVWKSLEYIDRQLLGEGDVDILFTKNSRNDVLRLLSENKFVLDLHSTSTVGPDVLIYRGFDEATGTFVSLHVHFACRFGSKNYKEVRYPFEQDMLATPTIYRGVKLASQAHFLTIRLLAYVAKDRKSDSFVDKMPSMRISGECLDELDRNIRALFSCSKNQLFEELAQEGSQSLHDYSQEVMSRIDEFESRELYVSIVDRYRKRLSINERIGKLLCVGRNKIGHPCTIVITGHDGTGKSTVCEIIQNKAQKISPIKRFYIGRKEWGKFNSYINNARLKGGVFLILNYIWPICSGIELLSRCLKANLMCRLGFIVIFDRSLFDTVIKYGRKANWAERLTYYIFTVSANHHGNMAYVLYCAPEVALGRKPIGKYSKAYLREKQNEFEAWLPEHYLRIDTTYRDADEVANLVIAKIFAAAA